MRRIYPHPVAVAGAIDDDLHLLDRGGVDDLEAAGSDRMRPMWHRALPSCSGEMARLLTEPAGHFQMAPSRHQRPSLISSQRDILKQIEFSGFRSSMTRAPDEYLMSGPV
jgi:hypothetical protein